MDKMSPSLFIEPLDLKTIYLDYFLGNQLLFPFAFIIILSFVSALFGISNTIFLILLAIGSVMFGGYMGEPYYVLILFLIGFTLYKIFGRVFQ